MKNLILVIVSVFFVLHCTAGNMERDAGKLAKLTWKMMQISKKVSSGDNSALTQASRLNLEITTLTSKLEKRYVKEEDGLKFAALYISEYTKLSGNAPLLSEIDNYLKGTGKLIANIRKDQSDHDSHLLQNEPNTDNKQSAESIPALNDGFIEIGDIVNNPTNFNNEFVKIRGLVIQYTQGDTQTTSFYLLKSDYGAIIRVNTAQGKPETNAKYDVTGTVVIDQTNHQVYLVEQSKYELTDTPVKPESPLANWTILFLIGGIILLIILVIVYFVIKSSSGKNSPYTESLPHLPKAEFEGGSVSSIDDDTDFKTIRISQSSPKTLKIIPGKLQIIAGLDKGKEFPIMGFPGSDGCVLSIGREKGNSESELSHIQLLEKTVSRRQAEIMYVDNKLFVKNLSGTNFTRLNGIDLKIGETGEVVPDSIIKTGEVEFKYIL